MAPEGKATGTPWMVEFGPYRVIGVGGVSRNDNGECSALWERDFLPRLGEIAKLPGDTPFFGICRCVPGATDGSFEYIAAVPVAADAPIPAGMMEAQIAAAIYLVFPVAGLAEIGQAWGQIGPWMEAHPEWEGYCDPAGCDCATYPGFELYPPTFGSDGRLFIYVPVKRTSKDG